MTEPDDDLGRRLRDVLRDGELNVPAEPDALERIHAGASRRRNRRNAASSAAAVVVVAIAATGVVALRPHAHAIVSAGKQHTTSSSASLAPPIVASVVSPALTAVPQPASASASQPSVSTVAVTFDPISVTAISTNSYWVLGSTACAAQRCAALAHTTDGGATFTRLGRTSDGSPMPPIVTTVEDGTTVRDVRFGDTENGWMYGGALYTTHDGGATWAPDNSIPNDVVDMAAASGEVWAVALRVVGSSESYGLYHATYGASGTSAWAEVNLGGVTILDQPKLAVIDTTSFLLATQPSGQAITLVLTNGVGSHTSVPGPCKLTPAQSLSVAGDGALWAFCAAGHTGEIYVSINSGTSWTGGMISEMGPIGGVDSSHAFVAIGTGLKLVTVDNGGAHSTTISPFGQSQLTGVKFIGFTTINVGFAVVYDQNSGSELWRTTDGGQTWAVVAF